MSTFKQITEGLNKAWDSITEGWQQLSERTAQALTRFNPIHHEDETDSKEIQVERAANRWGLLAAEVSETADAVTVRLEIPGMEANSFDIQVVDDVLIVRGEKRVEKEEKRGRYYIMECAYGAFERAVPLPTHVDDSQATATYRRGVLKVTLPKAHHIGRRRIEVSPS